jgi:hypothetical protein
MERKMKWVIAISLSALLGACTAGTTAGLDPEAAARYRAAWEKRRAGDEAGYRAGLQAVAAMSPDSRAGQRAREDLQASAGGLFGGFGVVGTVGLGLLVLGVPAAVAGFTVAPR